MSKTIKRHGWQKPDNAFRYHYFDNDRYSLCTFATCFDGLDFYETTNTKRKCADCAKKLKQKEEQKNVTTKKI